ncbi:sugar ABC transporter substrate-binding protein [Acetobacteraceae bacterium KSS8]|uniref:Sugar ABC transporter substrate-binding protein n=1 Tax=Endosaccharibacter trunci TaxID=2812733 RepID=A0ABT1WCD4_9PROT|nr:sugar ABC transporter substrate-binding protein [Acetobacteraceae bacterium KSS8]
MSRTSKLLSSAALIAASIAALAAGPAMAQTKPVIGLAVANLQADFFNQIKQSAEAEAKAKGADLVVVDAHGDSATQVNQIQDLITRGVKAIIYIPAGATAAGVPVRAAEKAHIPVVAVDRNAPDAPAQTFIASDSVAAAHTLGDYVCKQTGGKGVIGVIQGQIGTTPQRDREKGFDEALKSCPGLKIVAEQPSQEWSQAEGFNIGQDMLQRHPEITVFFGQADGLALGAAQAVKVANADHPIMVVGFDGDVAALKAVQKGTLAATMTQKTRFMGRLAVDSALDLINGKSLPSEQLQPAVLTTKSNVAPFITTHP